MSNLERVYPEVRDEGFTELYPHGAVNTDEIVADLIFVHGLMGHPRKTWQCGKTPKETKSKTHSIFSWKKGDKASRMKHDQATSNKVCYWPFDLLPLDVKNVRILTYGYDSHPSHFCTGPTNRMTISQHAENLLQKIVDLRSGHTSRPIIFVAHSLGGILVKDAVVESRKFSQYSQNFRLRQVYEQCRAIFFFGTPHSGATLAEWGVILSNILGSVPGPVSTYSKILRELGPDSEKLEMVTKDFNDVLDADIPREKKIKICSLCEGKGMSGLNVFDGQVVPTHSATFGRRDIEVRVFIQKNHMHMCQFESRSDPGYESFKSTLLANLSDIQQAKGRGEDISNQEQYNDRDGRRAALLESLDFADRHMRENQLWDIQANPKTFQWVWSSSFAQWLSDRDSLFWICGKPASGKSTLIRHLIHSQEIERRLRRKSEADWIIIHHFFDFRAHIEGESVRNTFEGFLRSLLFQLISRAAEIVWDDANGQNHSSKYFKQHWSINDLRKRLQVILQKSSRWICIFVDGLDEYASGLDDIETLQWDLAQFLKDISGPRSKLKLCIASRPEKVFLAAFAHIPSLMMQDWNRRGISEYVDLTLRRSLAKSGFYEDKELVRLSEEIAARSEGVFLWAHFAINQLRNGWARADDLDMPSLRKKLDQVSPELDQIYSRIFQTLQPDDRRSVGYMLQLICFARRDISLDELWVATARAEGREVMALTAKRLKRFERRLYAITGGVLDIFWTERKRTDKHDMETGRPLYYDDMEILITRGDPVVTLIHRTVRNFLDSKGWSEILDSREEVVLQSENLWLRLCLEEFSSIATAADSTLTIEESTFTTAESTFATAESTSTTAESMVAALDNIWEPNDHSVHYSMLHIRHCREHRFLLSGDGTTSLNGSASFMNEHDLERYLDKRVISLRQYAALFMLDHAGTVERTAGNSMYSKIWTSLTTWFLQLHNYYWSCIPLELDNCRLSYEGPLAWHPLHLAIAHGLNLSVSEYLTSHEDHPLPETYITKWPRKLSLKWFNDYLQRLIQVDFHSRHRRVELLEFAVFYADDPIVLSKILAHRKLDVDAALVTALQHMKSLDVIQYLLQFKAASGPVILSPPGLQYWDALLDLPNCGYGDPREIGISTHNYPHLLASQPNVGPLWVIARHFDCVNSDARQYEKFVDFLISRGEDINGNCGPFGTALHAAVTAYHDQNTVLMSITILLERGADINASGPLGTPLEVVWMIYRKFRTPNPSIIEALIKHGGVNNRPDPDGKVPSKEHMMKACG